MTKPLYIFDLDGTLADLTHRRHFVERPSLKCYDCGGKNWKNCVQCGDLDAGFKPDWDAFHAACVNDTPIEPVITIFKALGKSGADLRIWSGRMETVRLQTLDWLSVKLDTHSGWAERLKMRPANDYTVDHVLKESWLNNLNAEDRARLVCVFDDRQQVVDMWRRNGVLCCQVAPGDF